MNPESLTWRLLTAEELTDVYLNEMRRDFPAGELKPLSMILNSEAAGTAHTWGVYEDDALVAYLLMVRPVGCEVSQLDYFAVLPQYRAGGIGAVLLAALPDHEKGAQAILIEAECPEKAEDEAMAVRRLGFYARCGAKDTGWTEHLFDAWFRVLVLPCCGGKVRSPEEAVRQLADCYRRAMTRAVTSGCKSIAFPLIFSGEYHIPREEAIYIAGQAITDFIRRSPALDVVLVLYKPGIYLMAKRILGWDDTHSYETSAK